MQWNPFRQKKIIAEIWGASKVRNLSADIQGEIKYIFTVDKREKRGLWLHFRSTMHLFGVCGRANTMWHNDLTAKVFFSHYVAQKEALFLNLGTTQIWCFFRGDRRTFLPKKKSLPPPPPPTHTPHPLPISVHLASRLIAFFTRSHAHIGLSAWNYNV